MTTHEQFTSTFSLMQGMSVQHLRLTVIAKGTIQFSDQPGSAIRGALYHALANHFCSASFQKVTAEHVEHCPVCWLMAMEDPENQRGRDVTRPLTVQPPEKTEYRRDEVMTFGLSLMGKARSIMPYLVRAIEWMGKAGLGRYRGQFKLMSVHEFSPLFDVERLLMDGTTVQTPTLAVTPSHIREIAHTLPTDKITLQFRTPTRLTSEGKLVKQATPTVMMNRLLERCQNLVTHYAETDDIPNNDTWKLNAIRMTELAQQIRIAYSELEWVDVFSGSKRQGRMTPISGFVGIVRWEGDISSLREWLLWGQSLHVGKDAVKGNGYYRVMN